MPKPILSSGDEPIDYSALCIRVMEAFFEKVDEDDRFNQLYMDLWDMYGDVLNDELAPFAFELALEAFSERDRIVVERRRARDAQLPEATPLKKKKRG